MACFKLKSEKERTPIELDNDSKEKAKIG